MNVPPKQKYGAYLLRKLWKNTPVLPILVQKESMIK